LNPRPPLRQRARHLASATHTVDATVPVKLITAIVHHVGVFRDLEEQTATFVTREPSPDRLDAAVHALTEFYELPSRRRAESGKSWTVESVSTCLFTGLSGAYSQLLQQPSQFLGTLHSHWTSHLGR
jgi:hypothetical protein